MCLFCDIVAGTIAADIVFDDDVSVVFLDHRPVFKGHCLIVPRRHFEVLSELPDELIAPFFATVRSLSERVPEVLGSDGSFVAINNRVSQSVPHLHVHVVPRKRKDGLRGFFWPRHKYADDAERASYASTIRAALAR